MKFFKALFFSILYISCSAYGTKSGGGASSLGGNSLGSGLTSGKVFSAAVQSSRIFEVRPVQVQSKPAKPTVVEIDGGELPVEILFKSISSPIKTRQEHRKATPGPVEATTSNDEPYVLRHSVTKPIIQEIREIIKPIRRITKQVEPVQEEVITIVARKANENGNNADGAERLSSQSGNGLGVEFVNGESSLGGGRGSESLSRGLVNDSELRPRVSAGKSLENAEFMDIFNSFQKAY